MEYIQFTEDCLVLNVHVPSHVNLSDPERSPANRLPVLFWIHGGAFFLGSGISRLFDGRFLSEITNSVIVTINYRLGNNIVIFLSRGNYGI